MGLAVAAEGLGLTPQLMALARPGQAATTEAAQQGHQTMPPGLTLLGLTAGPVLSS